MAEPGSIGKKPQGSFVNTSQMVDDIKRKKELESLEQMKDRKEEEALEEEEKKQNAEIDKLLPERVESAFGELPYATFKELYQDVFDAVANKDHWSLGYVSHAMDLYDGVPVRVRTLRKREADVLRGVAPKGAAYPGADIDQFNAERAEYETVRLLVCLQQFGEIQFEDSVKLSLANFSEWRESKDAKARAEQVDDLPDEVISLLGAVINDTMVAYRCAMTENLKNQLAPLSRTTASD